MEVALNLLQGRNVIVDSVLHLVDDFYPKFGFHRSSISTCKIQTEIITIPEIQPVVDIDMTQVDDTNMVSVMNFDKNVSTINRSDHMPGWLISADGITYGAFHNGECVGYICVKYNPRLMVYVLQPLYANTPDIALQLICTMLQNNHIPVPCTLLMAAVERPYKEKCVTIAKTLGETKFNEMHSQRMFTKRDVKFTLDKVYSITNPCFTVI